MNGCSRRCPRVGTLFLVLAASACGGRIASDPSDDASTPSNLLPDADIASPDTSVSTPPRDAAAEADGNTPRDAVADSAAVAPCLVGGNVMHFEGDPGDPVFSGSTTVRDPDGYWSVTLAARESLRIDVQEVPADTFTVAMQTTFMNDTLHIGVYDNAQGPASRDPRPSLVVAASGHVCGIIHGRFEITDLRFTAGDRGDLMEVTASFEQRCDASNTTLRGCFHFSR